jgi:hypothetical protein
MTTIPDIYQTRVNFELDEENGSMDDNILTRDTIKDVLYECFNSKDLIYEGGTLCSTGYSSDFRKTSMMYGLYGKLCIRFYNGDKEKWTFEDLNTFIDKFIELKLFDYDIRDYISLEVY